MTKPQEAALIKSPPPFGIVEIELKMLRLLEAAQERRDEGKIARYKTAVSVLREIYYPEHK